MSAANGIIVVLNRPGIRKYLQSESVKAELQRRAENIKKRAGGEGYAIDSRKSPTRVRVEVAAVSEKAKKAESERGTLRRAIGD